MGNCLTQLGKKRKESNMVFERGSSLDPTPAHNRSYDEETLALMRWQLQYDSEAFLLNNILLSVQFFENYEREVHQIKNNPSSERENLINEAMVRENKHVFFADRLQECIHKHVCYQRNKGQTEPLSAPRLFVIYDNVEASEPGDTSYYSAVLDAPFYKLQIEDDKRPGYVKLKKIEVLEGTLHEANETAHTHAINSDDNIYTDSVKECEDIDETPLSSDKDEEKLTHIEIKPCYNRSASIAEKHLQTSSQPVKQVRLQVANNDITNINNIKNSNVVLLLEETPLKDNNNNIFSVYDDYTMKPKKSILKNIQGRQSVLENNIIKDPGTLGLRSNFSNRHTLSKEIESDYGYSTITTFTTPKKIELSMKTNNTVSSSVLPVESWTAVTLQALKAWSDEDDETVDNGTSKSSLSQNLFERCIYLNSISFMNNFVDNFITNLGFGLGFSTDQINSALTQGASIYCDYLKSSIKMGCEILPALVAAWPNVANQWIIRERKIVQNPRTNFTYQWPTKSMVNKTVGTGCLLVPVGFRPKRGFNPDQTLQWKLIYPEAERYLEGCLAHSHIRCYLFTLVLHKSFMENDTSKIGIDASHIKNHLFWQCEDNYAKWPEDRLGESLRLFLRSFYANLAKSRLRNYFMENFNEFGSIPKPILLKVQRRIADIIEAPVMHVLSALDQLKYTKRDFYPAFNGQRLYDILTCKNPLRILNPNIPSGVANNQITSDSDDDTSENIWDNIKVQDKHYQWKKERQRQMQERRKSQIQARKQKPSIKQDREINRSIRLPVKMDSVRRRLVLELFVPHFIVMSRSSDRFEAIKQAIIYLEHAHRLCLLLLDEPGAEMIANDYIDVIRHKLADCQRKLVQQQMKGAFEPPRRESYLNHSTQSNIRIRSKFRHIVNIDSPTGNHGASEFTFPDVQVENTIDLKRFNDK